MEQADPSQYETRLAVCKACKWVNEQHLYDQEIPENTGFTNEYIAE